MPLSHPNKCHLVVNLICLGLTRDCCDSDGFIIGIVPKNVSMNTLSLPYKVPVGLPQEGEKSGHACPPRSKGVGAVNKRNLPHALSWIEGMIGRKIMAGFSWIRPQMSIHWTSLLAAANLLLLGLATPKYLTRSESNISAHGKLREACTDCDWVWKAPQTLVTWVPVV